MKTRILILFFPAILFNCNKKTEKYVNLLSEKEKKHIIEITIRYTTKLAPGASHETKFFPEFDWYYDKAVNEYDLLYFQKEPDSCNYFFMTRVARSITPMKEGIGGKIKIDKSGNLVYYEEIFRTWKMPEDTLNSRGLFLFDRMVNHVDLTQYTSKFQGDRYIEFPDDRFVFDKIHGKWIDKILDSP